MELGETATALQAAQTVTRLRTQNSVLNLAEGANPWWVLKTTRLRAMVSYSADPV
jgi:hypothetical protein